MSIDLLLFNELSSMRIDTFFSFLMIFSPLFYVKISVHRLLETLRKKKYFDKYAYLFLSSSFKTETNTHLYVNFHDTLTDTHTKTIEK